MADTPTPQGQADIEILTTLNRNYIRAVDQSDVRWFDQHLAADFCNTNPNGELVDRAGFLAQIASGSTVRAIQEQDVKIRVMGDYAIIHARTTYQKPDGTHGAGRYTDDWHRRDGRWVCVSAHVSRS